MSYEKVSSLTFNDKRMTVTCNYSCNNDTAGYQKLERICKDLDEYNSEKRGFYDGLVEGTLQFNMSCKSKSHYAYLKTLIWLFKTYESGFTDLWYSPYDKENNKFTKEETERITDESYEVFCKHLNDKLPQGDVYLELYSVDSLGTSFERPVYFDKVKGSSYRYRLSNSIVTLNYMDGLNIYIGYLFNPKFKATLYSEDGTILESL